MWPSASRLGKGRGGGGEGVGGVGRGGGGGGGVTKVALGPFELERERLESLPVGVRGVGGLAPAGGGVGGRDAHPLARGAVELTRP